ncbi:HIT family protein [Agromyces soli]|uniref:HIT domain-containing protein n=1 Tax=Agromyces soli TaxID=659012 RepID=A0ABY4AZV0_9MICO|nr:HIT domain-containing protein [Agromyces soli]UOE26325.1 HIT domain-containing protein [Agromyces soli]
MSDTRNDCPFCEIVVNEDSDAREIYRDAETIAFFPTEPAILGHTMVIPRRHVPDIWELDENTAARLASTTLAIASAIRDTIKPDGLNVIQSNGAAASQTVMHVHVHVVPRWENDRIGRIWPPESDYSEAQKDVAWEALRGAVRKLKTK